MLRYVLIKKAVAKGRSYVRSNTVLELKVSKGNVVVLVQGSGAINGSEVSKGFRGLIYRKKWGLFPLPKEIQFDCSCTNSSAN